MSSHDQTPTPSPSPQLCLDHRHRAAMAAVASGRHLSPHICDVPTLQLAHLERARRAGTPVSQDHVDPNLLQAWQLHQGDDLLLRSSLEALLLVEPSADLIARQLSLSPQLVESYRLAFFDTASMPDEARLLHVVIQSYQGVPEGELMPALFWKIIALREGPQALATVMEQGATQPLLRAAQYLAQAVRPVALQRLVRAMLTLQMDGPPAVQRLQDRLEHLETELAESPEDELAARVQELFESFANVLTRSNPPGTPPDPGPYENLPAELSCEENLRAGCGLNLEQEEMIQTARFPDSHDRPDTPTDGTRGAENLPGMSSRQESGQVPLEVQVLGPAVRKPHPILRRRVSDGQYKMRRVRWEKLEKNEAPYGLDYRIFLQGTEECLRAAAERTPQERAQDAELCELMSEINPRLLRRRHDAYQAFLEKYPKYRRPPLDGAAPPPTSAPSGAADEEADSAVTRSASFAAQAATEAPHGNPPEQVAWRGSYHEDEFLRSEPRQAFAGAPATPEERLLDDELIRLLEAVPPQKQRLRRRKLRIFLNKHPDYELPHQRRWRVHHRDHNSE